MKNKIKTKKVKKEKKQIVEIHIYVHQDNSNGVSGIWSFPQYYPTISSQPCPICGKIGQHTCVTC